jgi:uncharacterized protein
MAKKQQATRRRKTPLRTCIVCGEVHDKRELLRIVRTETEGVQLDPGGKRNGRGAYVCRDRTACDGILRREALNRALRTTISEQNWEQVQEQLMQH